MKGDMVHIGIKSYLHRRAKVISILEIYAELSLFFFIPHFIFIFVFRLVSDMISVSKEEAVFKSPSEKKTNPIEVNFIIQFSEKRVVKKIVAHT